MTEQYCKAIEIASNDDIEYFGRSLSKSLFEGRTNKLMLSEVEAIASKMSSNNLSIKSLIKDTVETRYVVFHDELTYAEFMLSW